MPEKYQRNPNTACTVCKRPIYKRPVEIERNRGHVFCSTTCYGISSRKETPCVMCGTPMLAGLNKKTCSRACANKHRIGIKYKLNRPRDKVFSEKAIKTRLISQRQGICERCGYSKLEILHVHHKDRNRSNNSMENLELICPNCHYEEHHLHKKLA